MIAAVRNMEPAPYTRETLDRIRKGATAAHLGWMSAFYDSVCRKHGLERNLGPEPPKVVPPPIFVRENSASWNSKTRELSRDSRIAAFAKRQSFILAALMREFSMGEGFVASETLEQVSGCRSGGSVRGLVAQINERIKPMSLVIRSRRGDGYRLVDLCSVGSVASASSETVKQE